MLGPTRSFWMLYALWFLSSFSRSFIAAHSTPACIRSRIGCCLMGHFRNGNCLRAMNYQGCIRLQQQFPCVRFQPSSALLSVWSCRGHEKEAPEVPQVVMLILPRFKQGMFRVIHIDVMTQRIRLNSRLVPNDSEIWIISLPKLERGRKPSLSVTAAMNRTTPDLPIIKRVAE